MGIARNAGYNIAGAAASLLVSVAVVPFYLRAVGVERFGVLALCWLILGLSNFLNLGMGPAIAQRLAALRDSSARERAEAFWTAAWLNVGLGLAGAVAVLLFAGAYFETVSDTASRFSGEMRHAMPWLAMMVPAVMLSGVMFGALQGREHFLAMNVINSASSILMSVLPLGVALLFGPRIDWLVAGALAGRIAALVLAYGACARAVPLGRPHRPVRALIRPLVAFGGWVTVTSLLAPIIVSIDRFALGALAGAAAVSIYAIPYNLLSRLTLLPVSLASALFPRFAAADGDHAADLQVESVSVVVTLMTPLSILLILALGPFLRLWIGAELAARATPLAYILVAGFWMNSLAHVPYAYLESRGRPDLIAKLVMAYLVPYVLILYGAIWLFGLVGAAAAASLRFAFDPFLFVLAGTFRRILPLVALPALLVLAAAAAALLLPWTTWPHWAVLGALLAISCYSAGRTLPASLRQQLARMRSAVPWARRFA
jgi:O-antigen/teichoic acid export membrane protein